MCVFEKITAVSVFAILAMFGKETTPQNMRANSEAIRKICRTGRIGFGGTVIFLFDSFMPTLCTDV